jgi:type IV pilus assembly protein PilV
MATSTPRAQSGAFLLEALIAILIFAFGILGIVGLQAQSLRVTNDSQYRAEAVYLASGLIAQMWSDDINKIKANYSMPSGAGYLQFAANVKTQLKGAWVTDPDVVFDEQAAPSAESHYVRIMIPFKTPGDSVTHQYVTNAVIGVNP